MNAVMGKFQKKFVDQGRDWFQIIAILVATIGSLTTGILISWPSPSMPKIVEDKQNYNVTEKEASLFAALNVIGLIILSPIFVPFINKIGSKRCILLSSIPYIITWLIKGNVTNIWGLYLARIVTGFGDVFIFICVPIYIGEISTPKVRGLWGNAFVCSLFLGQFIVNIIGTYFTVQETALICLTLPISLLIFFPFMPESPYYYIGKGKDEAAKVSLRKLRRTSNVDLEFFVIKNAVLKQLSDPSTWMDLFKIPVNRRAFLLLSFLRCSQLFGGLMAFAAFTKYIFQNSGADIDSDVAAIVYSAANAACHTFAAFFSSKLGRRKSYISSTFMCSIILVALGVYSIIKDYYPDIPVDGLSWFPLTGMLLYLLFCSFGLGTVATIMLGELFSSNIKRKGVALVASLFGLSAFAVNNLFYYLASHTGLCGPFFFFAGCNFLASFIAYFVLPETKDKTLEEIQEMLKLTM